MPSTPVRSPNGVNNAARPSTLQDAGLLDPSKYIVDFEDFHNYAAGDWTVTETQAGATQALSSANGAGGVMLLTNSAADNDVNQLQRAVESFKFVSGKQTWFKCRFKVSDVTQSDVYFGLIIFFTYFYVSITFDPVEVADNMKKYGGFIPGIRAGKPTAQYLDYVLTRLTLPGSVYLAVIAIIPFIAFGGLGLGQSFLFGGTSLLIMVGVGLDTVKQIESQLQQRNYEGFLK